jgi:hypothetical protein
LRLKAGPDGHFCRIGRLDFRKNHKDRAFFQISLKTLFPKPAGPCSHETNPDKEAGLDARKPKQKSGPVSRPANP